MKVDRVLLANWYVCDKQRPQYAKKCAVVLESSFLANNMLSPVRLSSVCLSSVTLVRRTQAVEIFGNISMALGTLAID